MENFSIFSNGKQHNKHMSTSNWRHT